MQIAVQPLLFHRKAIVMAEEKTNINTAFPQKSHVMLFKGHCFHSTKSNQKQTEKVKPNRSSLSMCNDVRTKDIQCQWSFHVMTHTFYAFHVGLRKQTENNK